MELFSSMQVDIALRRISNTKDNGVRWIGEYAENWFKEVVTEYVSTRYSKNAIKDEALKMQKKLEEIGTYKKIGQVKSELQHYLRSRGLRFIYEQFFGVDVAPEIDQYFKDSYHNMIVWVQRMREAGRIGF